VWGVARSTLYASRHRSHLVAKRGPRPLVEEDRLLNMIQEDIKSSPFRGEGHRKVHARLKRKDIKVGRNRVLGVMRKNQLLSPHRSPYRSPNPHDGQITTDAPVYRHQFCGHKFGGGTSS